MSGKQDQRQYVDNICLFVCIQQQAGAASSLRPYGARPDLALNIIQVWPPITVDSKEKQG